MLRAGPKRGWPRLRRRQEGQALIYGIFVLIGGLAALFFLFNTGQLTREKTKLVNTTDAVAYSAGVMHARALNFEAYTNRAMMANTVAIAQLVSLSSWIQYQSNLSSYGYVLDDSYKWTAAYYSYYAASEIGSRLQDDLNGDNGALERLATTSDHLIRDGLMTAQLTAYQGMLPARQEVMNKVAEANYRNDGTVVIDLVPLTFNEFRDFSFRYSDDKRTRFAEVANVLMKKDSFLPKRGWDWFATSATCGSAEARGAFDFVNRRGGTELVGFDEWKALDTISAKIWVPESWYDYLCLLPAEVSAGWAAHSGADNPSSFFDPEHFQRYDYSLLLNPATTGIASLTSDSWGYSGLPNFYDLSEDALKQDDPRLKFAIRVHRDVSQTQTSEGRSAVVSTPRINAYKARPAGGSELIAVSASEVFFARPDDVKDNAYGKELNKPREIGSLFNPFWEVHLIQSDSNILAAQALQGVVLPP